MKLGSGFSPAEIVWRAKKKKAYDEMTMQRLKDQYASPLLKSEPISICQYTLEKIRVMDIEVSTCASIISEPQYSASQKEDARRRLTKVQSYYSIICA